MDAAEVVMHVMQADRGHAERTMGNVEQAQQILTLGKRNHPEDPLVEYGLACYAAQLRQFDEAKERLKDGRGPAPRPQTCRFARHGNGTTVEEFRNLTRGQIKVHAPLAMPLVTSHPKQHMLMLSSTSHTHA